MSKKIKLLLISTAQLRGGAEEYLLMIGRYAAQRGWDVHLTIEKVPGTTQLLADFSKEGIICHHTKISDITCRITKKYGILRQSIITSFILLKVRPDIILVNMPGWTTSLGVLLACAVLKIPTLATFHLFPWQCKFGRKRIKLYQWFLTRNQKWVAVSENNRKYISETFEVDKNAISMIYNGVKEADLSDVAMCRKSVREELKLQQDDYMILTVARLDAPKGYQDMIPVVKQLSEANRQVKFVWVGEGQDRDVLTEMVRYHGLNDHVIFLGYRCDVYRLMKASDLFLFPSHAEGFGLVLVEAMACGLSIVSSDTSSIPELIQDGVHGRLFRVGDCFAMLDSIRLAMSDLDATRKMAQNARFRSQDFLEDRCVKKTLDLMEELLIAVSGNSRLCCRKE
ncbi:MAG: glycosyltransferase family 4 protein [Candidatus Omnitrophota bacterium]